MKLSDASWIAPLLQAVVEGKIIQVLHGSTWRDSTIRLSFEYSKESYRIKPEVLKYRHFLIKCGNLGHTVGVCLKEQDMISIESSYYFVKWIGPWQEVEL